VREVRGVAEVQRAGDRPLLNVALCDEKLGRFASASAKFAEARDRAKEQGMDVHRKAARSTSWR